MLQFRNGGKFLKDRVVVYPNLSQYAANRAQTAQSEPKRGPRESVALRRMMKPRAVKSFIPFYSNKLPTVPKPPRASRTASLVFSDLPASQGAITRLLNRCRG